MTTELLSDLDSGRPGFPHPASPAPSTALGDDGRVDGGAAPAAVAATPVFVDATGRRVRRFRAAGYAATVACAAYLSLLAVTVSAGPVDPEGGIPFAAAGPGDSTSPQARRPVRSAGDAPTTTRPAPGRDGSPVDTAGGAWAARDATAPTLFTMAVPAGVTGVAPRPPASGDSPTAGVLVFPTVPPLPVTGGAVTGGAVTGGAVAPVPGVPAVPPPLVPTAGPEPTGTPAPGPTTPTSVPAPNPPAPTPSAPTPSPPVPTAPAPAPSAPNPSTPAPSTPSAPAPAPGGTGTPGPTRTADPAPVSTAQPGPTRSPRSEPARTRRPTPVRTPRSAAAVPTPRTTTTSATTTSATTPSATAPSDMTPSSTAPPGAAPSDATG